MLPFHPDFITRLLALPRQLISYSAGRSLAAMRPGRAVVETDSGDFDVREALEGGHLEGALLTSVPAQLIRRYREADDRLEDSAENAVYELSFQGCRVEVVVLTFTVSDYAETRSWIIAPDRALADALVRHVCRATTGADREILVYEHGVFHKDDKLYAAVHDVTLDGLVLRGSMRDDLVADVKGFFAARAVYERYKVPYKRGILLYGPPGNGKTHFLKGLIAQLEVPCIYVKSLADRHDGHDSMRLVFSRARRVAPCVLVFEDLDSLLREDNRSFFLNELDGFAENTGVVVLATTNYPEKIDPAIIDRPSRFDRKYLFDLPQPEERRRYLACWSDRLEPEMRLEQDELERVVAQTGGFSFAYLKELTTSAIMAWIATRRVGGMGDAVAQVLGALKEQAHRGKSPGSSKSGRRVGLIPEA